MFKLIKEADPKFPEDISGDCRDLLKKLLIKDPRKRLGKGGSE